MEDQKQQARDERAGQWIRERHNDIVELGLRVEESLFSKKSAFQRVEIVRTAGHGRVLLTDGIVMTSERDEFIYHEMIAHVPLFVHPDPRRVLIIGGGDGGTAREVLRHRSVARVVMVEIDEVVIEACRRFMPALWPPEDPRLEMVVGDGIRFAEESDERFDVVLVDSSDPVGPAEGLFSRDFYGNVARLLAPGGILVTQAESPFYDVPIQRSIFANQRPFFDRLHMYLYSNLTYPGGLWSFGFASMNRCPLADFDASRMAEVSANLRYYNSRVHRAAFVLPGFIDASLGDLLDSLPE
ncbi:MAG: polyamine aminopropyltransferase [Desulfobacterales bacterium]